MQELEGCWLHLLRVGEAPRFHVGGRLAGCALVRAGTHVQSRESAVHHHVIRMEESRVSASHQALRQSCSLEQQHSTSDGIDASSATTVTNKSRTSSDQCEYTDAACR